MFIEDSCPRGFPDSLNYLMFSILVQYMPVCSHNCYKLLFSLKCLLFSCFCEIHCFNLQVLVQDCVESLVKFLLCDY